MQFSMTGFDRMASRCVFSLCSCHSKLQVLLSARKKLTLLFLILLVQMNVKVRVERAIGSYVCGHYRHWFAPDTQLS